MPEDEIPDSGEDTAPIDYDVLDRLGHRLAGSERFEDVEYRPESFVFS